MGEPSKELLDLPSDPRPPASFIESLLLAGSSSSRTRRGSVSRGRPLTPSPKAKLLGKSRISWGRLQGPTRSCSSTHKTSLLWSTILKPLPGTRRSTLRWICFLVLLIFIQSKLWKLLKQQ
uniref:Uncharacterized protein n=1 Tax=Saccharum hybrid cultivar SP80-3280 TaxID=193079 RepID=A0A4P2TED1_9POAL|nr:hypothetical protein Sh083P14_g0220 [Saccharum hybrid cultivar SP80-3280]